MKREILFRNFYAHRFVIVSTDSSLSNCFAANFHTPEEFFLGEKVAPFNWGSVDPAEVLKKGEEDKEKLEKQAFHSEVKETHIKHRSHNSSD